MEIRTDSQKPINWNLFSCMLMFVLTLGTIVYAIARDSGIENASLPEEFVIDVILLVSPFLGICSAFRIARTENEGGKIIGWLFVAVFAVFFIQSAMIEWIEYGRCESILHS
jgi:hypothetical protein